VGRDWLQRGERGIGVVVTTDDEGDVGRWWVDTGAAAASSGFMCVIAPPIYSFFSLQKARWSFPAPYWFCQLMAMDDMVCKRLPFCNEIIYG
jgi:hypothetical protein